MAYRPDNALLKDGKLGWSLYHRGPVQTVLETRRWELT
jgi:hypothetical protein